MGVGVGVGGEGEKKDRVLCKHKRLLLLFFLVGGWWGEVRVGMLKKKQVSRSFLGYINGVSKLWGKRALCILGVRVCFGKKGPEDKQGRCSCVLGVCCSNLHWGKGLCNTTGCALQHLGCAQQV